MNDLFRLDEKNILVTGGSSGIGKATAILLSQLGARVTIVGRDEERLNNVLAMLDGSGHRAVSYDLCPDIQGIPAWMKGLVREAGPFAGLVHSAGVELTAPIRSVGELEYRKVMQVNTDAAFFLAKGLAQKKCHDVATSLVLVASVASLTGQPGRSVYCMSKGALVSLARALAVELAGKNIRVNCISPGQVRSEMDESIRDKMTPEQYEAVEKAHPLGLGEPQDIAGTAAFLLGDTGRWITGSNLVVDGGYTAQ
jgi:NAD(P)-dependent dehydrogenase (short-subunit alcohol dehydrogenase family)